MRPAGAIEETVLTLACGDDSELGLGDDDTVFYTTKDDTETIFVSGINESGEVVKYVTMADQPQATTATPPFTIHKLSSSSAIVEAPSTDRRVTSLDPSVSQAPTGASSGQGSVQYASSLLQLARVGSKPTAEDQPESSQAPEASVVTAVEPSECRS